MHTCIHAYNTMHAYMYTCIRTYIRTHTYMNIEIKFHSNKTEVNKIFKPGAHWPNKCTWFLEITFMRANMCVCFCVCPPPRPLITSGMI